MENNKELSCKNCKGHCNKKGYPSVTKHSPYCDKQRKQLTIEKISFWKRLKKMIQKQRQQMKHGFRRPKGLEKSLLDKLEKENKN